MMSKKCPQCGLVNFAQAPNCKRCNADLSDAHEVSQFSYQKESSGTDYSNQKNSKWVYFVAAGVGMPLAIVFFAILLTTDRTEFFVMLAVLYAAAAFVLTARRAGKAWLLALSLSFFYLLVVWLDLSEILERNQKYGNMFWSNNFYLSPVLVFISIPLAAFCGARFGSKRTMQRFSALISVFFLSVVAAHYASIGPRPAKELNYSTEIVAGESGEFAMQLDIGFRLQVTDDPMHFRTVSTPTNENSKGGFSVTVLRKNATFSPDIHMMINVDGKDIETTMWPINRPNGTSYIDFSQKQDYRSVVNWRIGPGPDLMNSLATSQQISLTWGNVNADLLEEQVRSLRVFVRKFIKLLYDEGMVCTNPMCKQGALNPSP